MKTRLAAVAILLPFVVLFSACSTVDTAKSPQQTALVAAGKSLKKARLINLSKENRALYYLQAAQKATEGFNSRETNDKAVEIYNEAAAELTTLLRSDKDLWHFPLELHSSTCAYKIDLTSGKGLWPASQFSKFEPASHVDQDHLRKHFKTAGTGGPLVGVLESRGARFEPRIGTVAPVTATLSFSGSNASLALNNPTKRKTARVNNRNYPLASDLSSVAAYHPISNELWLGFMSMIHFNHRRAGLYMLQPYDPERIPVIFVHGLMSTPQMWVNVLNELAGDPRLNGKFQYWVFRYPTGSPVSLSALRFRQELAKLQETYPLRHGFILVGHSMGGLLSRMQSINTERVIWDANFREHADKYHDKLPADHLLKQMLVFGANPKVSRIVFVCVPHRGSKLALSSIGDLGRKLISLPSEMVMTVSDVLGDFLPAQNGKKVELPTSITSLSPKNPTLIAMDKLPIRAPYHSIIGDRGRGDSPNSSDGVVGYWSSSLKGARSELIVPGSHGAYELPQTVDEYKRILLLHLKTDGLN